MTHVSWYGDSNNMVTHEKITIEQSNIIDQIPTSSESKNERGESYVILIWKGGGGLGGLK